MFNRKIGTISWKIHRPYEGMFGLGGGQEYEKEVTGNGYINLTNAIANRLVSVKAYGKTIQTNLPEGYTQVEYIRSSGTQAINTGVKYDGNDFVVKWRAKDRSTSQGTLFACTGAQPYSGGLFGTTVNRKYYLGYGTGLEIGYTTNDDFHEWEITVSEQNVTLKKDGVQIGTETLTGTIDTEHNIYLFCGGWTNSTNQTLTQFSLWDLDYWQLWKNGTLAFDGIACKDSNNTLGIYDKVSDTFLTNAGTGTFTAGSDVVPSPSKPVDIVCNNGTIKVRHESGLPLGYTLLDYITSDNGPYIDTGIKIASTDTVETEFANNSATGYGALYGVYKTGESSAFYANSTYYGYDVDNNKVQTNITVDTSRHKVTHNFTNGTLTIDQTTTNFTPFTFTNTDNNGLFTRMYNGSYGYFFKGSCKSHKIYRNGNLILNLIPAKDSSNNIGMYDLVSGYFFTNDGTGDFTYGQEVSDGLEIYTDGTTETINVSGKNLFDEQRNRNTGTSTSQATWGQVVAATGWSTSALIPVKEGQQYTVSYNTTVQILVFYYEADGTMQQSYDTVNGTNKTFTVPSGAVNVRLQVNKSTKAQIAELKTQLEQGSTATTYEAYYDGGTATAEMLLSVGDYKDEQEILSGAVSRNVGIKVLDGTEEYWGSISQTPDNVSLLTNCYTLAIPLGDAPITNRRVYCTHLQSSDTLPDASARQGYALLGNGGIGTPSPLTNKYAVGLGLTTMFPTIAGLKQRLAEQYAQGTPVIVVYPLSTSSTESVSSQTLNIQNGSNTITATGSISDLPLYAKYKSTTA